jgi:hypothetical protein
MWRPAVFMNNTTFQKYPSRFSFLRNMNKVSKGPKVEASYMFQNVHVKPLFIVKLNAVMAHFCYLLAPPSTSLSQF